ncbi:hypothetical protein GY45DRAFT_1324312 [Cubamyces sp. BRFM 1775]|nr:hypothetical protein GY45DRAFT_1324312 [Cubamyces sp. BRFM 1775]
MSNLSPAPHSRSFPLVEPGRTVATAEASTSGSPSKARTDRRSKATKGISLAGLRVPVPLPRDVDTAFSIPITVSGEPGLQIIMCELIMKQMPSETITRMVDNANKCIDDFVGGKRLCVHRGYFPSQRGSEIYVSTKTPPEPGFTVAHLLTHIIRKQYDGWIKSYSRIKAKTKLMDVVGPGEVAPPDAEVCYDNIYVVAIRRSTGADGRVRWFPQLEVRFQ